MQTKTNTKIQPQTTSYRDWFAHLLDQDPEDDQEFSVLGILFFLNRETGEATNTGILVTSFEGQWSLEETQREVSRGFFEMQDSYIDTSDIFETPHDVLVALFKCNKQEALNPPIDEFSDWFGSLSPTDFSYFIENTEQFELNRQDFANSLLQH